MMEPMAPVDVPGADVVRVEGPRQWVRFNRAEYSAASVLAAVTRAGVVRDLALEEPTIEEIVGRIYRRDVA
jgi:ABC-2 type transport system ATP-binding protein